MNCISGIKWFRSGLTGGTWSYNCDFYGNDIRHIRVTSSTCLRSCTTTNGYFCNLFVFLLEPLYYLLPKNENQLLPMTFFMYPYLRQESVFPVLHTSYLVDVHYLPCFETSCRAMKIFKIYKIAKNLARQPQWSI